MRNLSSLGPTVVALDRRPVDKTDFEHFRSALREKPKIVQSENLRRRLDIIEDLEAKNMSKEDVYFRLQNAVRFAWPKVERSSTAWGRFLNLFAGGKLGYIVVSGDVLKFMQTLDWRLEKFEVDAVNDYAVRIDFVDSMLPKLRLEMEVETNN